MRWTARAWGIASALLLLTFAFGGREHIRLTAREAIGFQLFPVGVIAGFAVAWRRELAGGLVTVGSLSLFYLWEFARHGQLPAGPYFLLFVTGVPPRRERPTHRAPGSGRGHCLSRR